MPKKREKKKRQPNKRILILCEGEKTEPYYFQGLKSDKYTRNKLSALRIEISDTKKNTAKELVIEAKQFKKNAEREKNPYDNIWVVFDKDGYSKHPQAFDQANSNDIRIAFSSISFEFWFLLHFQYTTKVFKKADDVINFLKNNKFMPDYEKNNNNYSILKDKTDLAIANAKKLRINVHDIDDGIKTNDKKLQQNYSKVNKVYNLNPYTDVDILVNQLLKL